MNTEVHNLYNWLTSNKLSLNIKKSNYVTFRPYQKEQRSPRVIFLTMNAIKKVTIERKNFMKYLGLLIDENLSWKTHISSVANKISKTIGIIARLRHTVPTCTLPNIYHLLIKLWSYHLGQRVLNFPQPNSCPSKTHTAFNIFC